MNDDWKQVLKQQCERKGREAVAREIGYGETVISQVLNDKYPGRIDKVESAVRGAYLGKTVHCPVIGELATHQCQEHQSRPFAATNPQRVRLYRACRNHCPHSELKRMPA